MAFHVACPITCKRICYCSLGFPTKLQSKRGKSQFEDEISRIQYFLKDPWLFRVRDDATVDVAVPKLPSPKQLVPVDVPAVEEVEVEEVLETKMIPVSSLVVEDFVPPVEAGALMVQDAPQDTTVEHGQLNANVNVTCQLCFSGENGGSERAKKMLPCRECGKKYHRNCLKTWSQHRDLFHWSSWACPTCRVCEVCRRHGDSNKFKFCKRCDGAFHCYCMQPPHKYVSSGPYLCSKHTKCHSCSSNVPGNGHCVRWFLGYTCCDACGRLFTKGKYCPVCLKVYRDSEATPMVCCDICQRWVHLQCDGISEQRYMQFQVDRNLPYTCPTCRGECYQVRDLDDAIQELWRRKDEEDRDLITSLRAAAGLPTQDDIFSISPFSDDEDNGQIARSAKFSYKSIVDCSPKKSKESVKKTSSKKYAKKKGHMVPLDSKNENFPEDHHDPQSLGFARSKEDRFHPDGPDLMLSPIAINSSSSDRNGPIKEDGVLNHKFVDEVTEMNVDKAAILPSKAKNVSDAIISEDGGKVTSKPKLMKGTKLVIHLGGRNKTIANSPRSDSSSIPREQELMMLRAGGNEAVSRHRMGEHLAERLDGAANSDDGYRVDNPNQTEVVKPRERNIIKLGKGKLGASGSNAMPARGNGLPSSESAHQMLSKRHNDQSTAAEGRQNSVSKADKVSLRRHPENKIDTTGGSNISRKPVLSSPDSSLRPSLRLKFKNPLLASLAPIGDEGKGFVNKGRRSKRKRPSHLVEKHKPQEEDNVIAPHDDSLENEILDSNWILKKLGRDAIGKRVKVHQPSDNSWHNGVVNDVVEGTSLLSIHLDNGRAKILELGKQGIRIVPQKQKRL